MGHPQDHSIFCCAGIHTEQLSLVRHEQHTAWSIQTELGVVLVQKRTARYYPDTNEVERIIINMSVYIFK